MGEVATIGGGPVARGSLLALMGEAAIIDEGRGIHNREMFNVEQTNMAGHGLTS